MGVTMEIRGRRQPRSVMVGASGPSREGGGEEPDPDRAFKCPTWAWRGLSALVVCGQVVLRLIKRKVHWKNFLNQLSIVGPQSLAVALLTSGFVGMAFTIQFVREFTRLGLTRSIGGVLALAMSRELSPVVTAIIIAGRVGSSFAAELGTMQVSEICDRHYGRPPLAAWGGVR